MIISSEVHIYLQQIQQDHDTGKENYLHSEYDTYVFYPNFTETNVLTMIRNGFIEAANRRLKFPSAVVILISDQIIVEDPLYLPSEIDRKIKWILRELDSAVKIRKSLLPTKAYTFGELRIMWVRAFQNTRANYIPPDIILKYNNMLRKTCMSKAVYTIPTDTYDDSEARCFDRDGKTQIKEGFNLIWHDIIKGIKKHDKSDKYAEIAATIKEHSHPDRNNHRRNKTQDNRNSRDSTYSNHRQDDRRKHYGNHHHNNSYYRDDIYHHEPSSHRDNRSRLDHTSSRPRR